MGSQSSTALKTEDVKLQNIKKLILDNDSTSEILDTLDLTEYKIKNNKLELPLIGGKFENNDNNNSKEKKEIDIKRFSQYDIFKFLKEIESKYQYGGDEKSDSSSVYQSIEDDDTMKHIKSVIMKELDSLKSKKQQDGGNCSCESEDKDKDQKENQDGGNYDDSSSSSSSNSSSSSDLSEYGKNNKKIKDSNSNFFIETSESGNSSIIEKSEEKLNINNNKSLKKNKKIKKLNNDKSEEGLSIFPFNSSDIKSSNSIKNYRMLRRKI